MPISPLCGASPKHFQPPHVRKPTPPVFFGAKKPKVVPMPPITELWAFLHEVATTKQIDETKLTPGGRDHLMLLRQMIGTGLGFSLDKFAAQVSSAQTDAQRRQVIRDWLSRLIMPIAVLSIDDPKKRESWLRYMIQPEVSDKGAATTALICIYPGLEPAGKHYINAYLQSLNTDWANEFLVNHTETEAAQKLRAWLSKIQEPQELWNLWNQCYSTFPKYWTQQVQKTFKKALNLPQQQLLTRYMVDQTLLAVSIDPHPASHNDPLRVPVTTAKPPKNPQPEGYEAFENLRTAATPQEAILWLIRVIANAGIRQQLVDKLLTLKKVVCILPGKPDQEISTKKLMIEGFKEKLIQAQQDFSHIPADQRWTEKDMHQIRFALSGAQN